MKTYPIQEHELTMLGTLNGMVALWCSIGSLAIAALIGCIWDLTNLPKDESPSKNAIAFIVVCFVVALGSFIAAWRFWATGSGVLAKIKSEVVG